MGSELDGSPSGVHGYRHRCCLEILALVGWAVLPSLHVSCANLRGLLDGDRGPKASVWPDCGVGIGKARARKTGEDDCGADAILEGISLILSENSKAAIAKWKDDMRNRGLATRWVKSRSLVGLDLQHHVNWVDEDHFEQCVASVPLVPRATHLATAKELVTRWNTGVDELDRDLPGVQLSRIVDASFHSANLVSCPAPVTGMETFLVGWSVLTIFMLKRFRILELIRGGLVTLIATLLLDRQALMLGMATLFDLWTCILSFQLCELLDRLSTSEFTKFPVLARVGPLIGDRSLS